MELLKSVDGISNRIALYMASVTMGFTMFESPTQFFCYAGLAPFKYTSRKSIHSKFKVSQRANKNIKALLHLGIVSAGTLMKDSEHKRYYERKTAEGKHPLSVHNVVRAKLVSRMFAVVRRDSEIREITTFQSLMKKNRLNPLPIHRNIYEKQMTYNDLR